MDSDDFVSESRRQRVVKALRYKAADGTDRPMETLKQILCLGDGKSYRDVFYALAWLIDRPTCRAVQPAACSFYECSVCGYDEWATTASIDNYCPHCGARVVGGATGSPQ